MIFSENQLRQFYVIDSANDTKAVWPTLNNNDYYYVKFDDQNVVTDKIKKGCIRDVRISKPVGFTPNIWTITVPSTINIGMYTITLDFKDLMGFGEFDNYKKIVSLNVTNTMTAADFISEFVALIKKALKYDAYLKSRLAVTSGANNIVLTEQVERITTSDIIRGIHRIKLRMEVGLSYDGDETDDWNTSYAVGETHPSVTITTGTAQNNGPEIAAMEYFFSKGRADLYGYSGFPDINPTEMLANISSDYYVLDIKYFFQDHGVLNQNSEKELTIVSTDKTKLEALIYSSETEGIVTSTTGTQITNTGNRDVEIYTVA